LFLAPLLPSLQRRSVAVPSQRQVKVEVPSCRHAVARVGCGCGVAVLTERSAVSFCPTLLHDLEQCGTQCFFLASMIDIADGLMDG